MASKRRIRRNQCGNKQRYPDSTMAHLAIKALRRRVGYTGRMNAYRCSFCSFFHIGHG